MRMAKILIVLISFVLMFTLTSPVFAAPPPDNPGKGPREVGKVVFVHYKSGAAPVKPEGVPNKPPKDENSPYSYSGIHWMDWFIPVSYYISYSGEPGNGANLVATMSGANAAFSAWERDQPSYIAFTCEGWTNLLPDVYDGYNVVGWGDLSQYQDAIAVTVVWYLLGTGWIVDCDVVLNNDPSLTWTQVDIGSNDPNTYVIDGPGYDVDIQNIMTHEAGHWLQLNDLYDEAAAEQTMYGYAKDGELQKRSLESGDIAGVRSIYPQRGKAR
jgi:hypothetical protein